MIDYSILNIPTVLKTAFSLADMIYNCPVCHYEIEIDIIVDDNSLISCENCDEIIKLNIVNIE